MPPQIYNSHLRGVNFSPAACCCPWFGSGGDGWEGDETGLTGFYLDESSSAVATKRAPITKVNKGALWLLSSSDSRASPLSTHSSLVLTRIGRQRRQLTISRTRSFTQILKWFCCPRKARPGADREYFAAILFRKRETMRNGVLFSPYVTNFHAPLYLSLRT